MGESGSDDDNDAQAETLNQLAENFARNSRSQNTRDVEANPL